MPLLRAPDKGFSVSTAAHNVSKSVALDWLEANVLFMEEEISKPQVVDFFLESGVYKDQTMAYEFVEELWRELRNRSRHLGASSFFEVGKMNFYRLKEWSVVPGHAFCVAAASRPNFRSWSSRIGDFNEQGRLFEEVVKAALMKLGWSVEATGWSGATTTEDFFEIVQRIGDAVAEPHSQNNVALEHVKDAGLDLVCHIPFLDGRPGRPVYLLQCASGENWSKKLRTPSLKRWGELVQFSAPHQRGIAIPFAIPSRNEFRSKTLDEEGILIDRYRLLSAGFKDLEWLEADLSDRLRAWLEPRIDDLSAELASC